MALASNLFQAVAIGTPEQRVEALRGLLGYPVKQRDPGGSRFWYLRPGKDVEEAEYTCPIAVGFYAELNDMESGEVPRWLTAAEQQHAIYGHYTNRVIPDQPVMYLLLPEGAQQGTVAMILPAETPLRQRQIQTFAWDSEKLENPLSKLKQGTLRRTNRMQETALSVVPLVEWAFYKPIETAKELAQQLAGVSRKIEQAIPAVYKAEGNDSYLHNLLTSFQRELLPTLKLKAETAKDYSFADIYAQTIAYGLFTARVFSYTVDERERRETDDPTRKERDFNRQTAWELLPETNPFLRRLFRDVSQQPIEVLGDELGDAISEVFSILRAAKMEAILEDFRSKMNREDIVIRFYEDFLAAYKPEMRERRGVYYTPEPVVSYMVRSVDILLKEKFDKPLGLADPGVMILDPACGTGTFLLKIFQEILKKFEESPEALTDGLADKSWSGYVKERLLPRVFGFELLMAPYAIAHLKLGLFLEETGYQFDGGKRLGVYLTNTLEEAAQKSESLLEEFIAEESDQAAEIKKDFHVMVVVGNPPYSGNSANSGDWITNLLRGRDTEANTATDNYFEVDGNPLNERQPKWLNDDYVKFIRFAHWRVAKTGYGITALITNHGYLSNPTFRGMRQSLSETFDTLYLLDLHGNSKKREVSPDGSKDENVFDIQQGTAIGIFVRREEEERIKEENTIFREDIWGAREEVVAESSFEISKYDWLIRNDVQTTQWNSISLSSPQYTFSAESLDIKDEYSHCISLRDAMPLNSVGFVSARDHFVVDFDRDSLEERIKEFRSLEFSTQEIKEKYRLKDTSSWNVEEARLKLREDSEWSQKFTKCLYRPFDIRDTYYSLDILERPVFKVMKHVLRKENLALGTTRSIEINRGWEHIFFCSEIMQHHTISIKEVNYIFPLYVYSDDDYSQKNLLDQERKINFSKGFVEEIFESLGRRVSPESTFFYIYSILHSPGYRERYAEFLKTDFPRIPVTGDIDLFTQLVTYGEELIGFHSMQSQKLEDLITQFEETGNRTVAPGHPKYQTGKVIINKQGDGFTGVPEEVWNFHIGGYQVCHKWLKDRKGRTLSDDDILHYQRIVVALKETITLMQKIDEAIPSWPIE